jgi:hypothetical protein
MQIFEHGEDVAQTQTQASYADYGLQQKNRCWYYNRRYSCQRLEKCRTDEEYKLRVTVDMKREVVGHM